jgi:cell division protein FtsL
MFRRPIFLFCIFFFVASFGTLMLKVHVQNLALDVKNTSITRDKLINEIRVLKAEWSYLNNSSRVKALAKQYLGLEGVKETQVKYIAEENMEMPEMTNEISKDIRQVNVDWKYKSRNGILKISNRKPQ